MALSIREAMEATPSSLDKDEFIKRLHEKMTGFESGLEEIREEDEDGEKVEGSSKRLVSLASVVSVLHCASIAAQNIFLTLNYVVF